MLVLPMAVHSDAPPVNTRLLEALTIAQVITPQDRDAALRDAVLKRAYVEDVLVDRGLLEEQRLLSFAAKLDRLFFVSTRKLCSSSIDRDLLARVDGELALALCIFPVKYHAKRSELVVAMAQATNTEARTRVQSATGVAIVTALIARPSAIRAMITKHYGLPSPPTPSRRGPPSN